MNTVLTILSHLGSTTAEWWAKEICCMQMLCWALLSIDAFTVSQFPPKMERIKWRQQQKSYIMHAPCGCGSRLGIWQCLSHVLVRLLFGPCVATADTRAPVWFFLAIQSMYAFICRRCSRFAQMWKEKKSQCVLEKTVTLLRTKSRKAPCTYQRPQGKGSMWWSY